MMTVDARLCKALQFAALPVALILTLAASPTERCVAQASAPVTVAALHDSDTDETGNAARAAEGAAAKTAPAAPDPAISPAVAKQLAAMQAEIEALREELKARTAATGAPTAASTPAAVAIVPEPKPIESATQTASSDPAQAHAGLPEKPKPADPFAYADWTWLNGNARNKDVVWDSKFFTPEVRMDIHYIMDLNHPKDDTMGGSTEIFRSNEIQLEQISFGGNFHWQNVNARILTMNGMFGVTTPRNDASAGRGQWDLRGAYKYVSEANAGYHFDVNHGLNLDAGIFVSYIGLFSYYNFDNWAYQPSYVSSNTPWFFNGLRIQWFPTNKLKIEPWIINGWQSYAKYNSHPGLGGQLLWLPTEWFKLVANQYGFGEDNLGLPQTQRIHTDDSIEVRYFNRPESLNLSKMAFSLTADAGCQYGGGLSCTGGRNTTQKSSFVGWMLYDRMWFHKDLFAITMGGGEMSNWGRYLT